MPKCSFVSILPHQVIGLGISWDIALLPIPMIGGLVMRSQLVGTSFFLRTALSAPMSIRHRNLCPPKIRIILGHNLSTFGIVQLINGVYFLPLVKEAGRHPASSLKVDLRWVSHSNQNWSGIQSPNGTLCGSKGG